jgi:ribonuclease G
MQQDILVNWSPQETRVALVENGVVQEIHVERPLERGLVGNIYLGKVVRVLPGMQSAFIDIGLERAAFLHVADVWQRQADGLPMGLARHLQNKGEVAAALPIEKQVFEGQSLMVQVIKEPIGSKGARLTTQISLAGRLLVFLPQDDHMGVSQKIPSAQRDELRLRLQQLAAATAASNSTNKTQQGQGGFILRTNAEDASDSELADDMRYLRKMWQRVRQAALTLPSPSLLYQDLSLLKRILRDLAGEQTHSIRIDSREQYGLLKTFGEEYMPMTAAKIEHYQGERPIFDLYRVDEEIAKALGRRVELKSGGYLIIDQTEALTTIDVNTGGFVGARNFDETVYKTNLEATHAIARQLRLRNLGGIILIDFIDMTRSEHRATVLAELNKQLSQDRVKTAVGDFSALGLVEMTRKRSRDSLAHMLTEVCPVCQGRGHVKTLRSVAYDILREILREARQFNPREFRIIAAPKVAELFLDEESQHLHSLSDFIGKPISLQSETTLSQEQYDIVLLQ